MKDLVIYIFAFFLTVFSLKISQSLYFFYSDYERVSISLTQSVAIVLLFNIISIVVCRPLYNFLEKRIGK